MLISDCEERTSYFNLKSLLTKSRFALWTVPSLLSARLRFFDFFVRMCRLKDFWCVILPVPVTLNLFLALEFVLTFGIISNILLLHPAGAPEQSENFLGHLGNQDLCRTEIRNGVQRYRIYLIFFYWRLNILRFVGLIFTHLEQTGDLLLHFSVFFVSFVFFVILKNIQSTADHKEHEGDTKNTKNHERHRKSGRHFYQSKNHPHNSLLTKTI